MNETPTRETHETGSFWQRNGTDEMWQLWWQHATIRMRHVPDNEFIDVTPGEFGSQFKPWPRPEKLQGPVRGACEDAPFQSSRSTDTLIAQWTAEATDYSRHPAARATSERYVTELTELLTQERNIKDVSGNRRYLASELFQRAQQYVTNELLHKCYISGTPSENDIATWLAEFTGDVLHAADLTTEQKGET